MYLFKIFTGRAAEAEADAWISNNKKRCNIIEKEMFTRGNRPPIWEIIYEISDHCEVPELRCQEVTRLEIDDHIRRGIFRKVAKGGRKRMDGRRKKNQKRTLVHSMDVVRKIKGKIDEHKRNCKDCQNPCPKSLGDSYEQKGTNHWHNRSGRKLPGRVSS